MEGSRPTVLTIETPTLGDRSYLVHDGQDAFVIDPQRDIDRVLDAADSAGVRITDVLETHIHNDYLTGGQALARETGARYHVNAADPVGFERMPLRDGAVVPVGAMRLHAIATPGHTFTHLAYRLEVAGTQCALFSGGSLLYGATGRPDLLGAEHTETLAHRQYASAHRLVREVDPDVPLYPTHGFRSFCAATQSDRTSSTLGRERQENPVLTQDEQAYVRELLPALGEWPAYYVRMAPANAAGVPEPDLSPPRRADPVELRRRIAAGEWVLDLRSRTAFAAGHAAGTVNLGLDGPMATYVGWLMPPGTPLTLLGETPDEVAEAQRELVRIGVDRPAACATGGPAAWGNGLASFRLATFADLAPVRSEVVVLDVRRQQERDAAHIRGSVHVPIHELPARLDDVPAGPVWVHCEAGYRAAAAASLLSAHGRQVVLIDDQFANAGSAGLPLS